MPTSALSVLIEAAPETLTSDEMKFVAVDRPVKLKLSPSTCVMVLRPEALKSVVYNDPNVPTPVEVKSSTVICEPIPMKNVLIPEKLVFSPVRYEIVDRPTEYRESNSLTVAIPLIVTSLAMKFVANPVATFRVPIEVIPEE